MGDSPEQWPSAARLTSAVGLSTPDDTPWRSGSTARLVDPGVQADMDMAGDMHEPTDYLASLSSLEASLPRLLARACSKSKLPVQAVAGPSRALSTKVSGVWGCSPDTRWLCGLGAAATPHLPEKPRQANAARAACAR